jgi:predicted transcriptional regulator
MLAHHVAKLTDFALTRARSDQSDPLEPPGRRCGCRPPSTISFLRSPAGGERWRGRRRRRLPRGRRAQHPDRRIRTVGHSTKSRLEKLAKSTGRSRAFLASEAISAYLDTNEWQVAGITRALASLDRGKGRNNHTRTVHARARGGAACRTTKLTGSCPSCRPRRRRFLFGVIGWWPARPS